MQAPRIVQLRLSFRRGPFPRIAKYEREFLGVRALARSSVTRESRVYSN